ncbi:hypothetical protein FB446DRAFT_770257 [Lentinula raphanica]|nr:hypothetical protein FB446DRAFT_770257 [Lentinula raphanica]
MLLSHISAFLVLGLLSTVQAAPTPGQSQSTPATMVTDVSDHDPELSDWEIVIQTAKCVQYLGLSVCGPFVTRVDFDNNKPISERRFTVEEADVPEKVWQKIKDKKSENFHDFPYPAPLQFSARWPSDWSKYPEHPNLKSPKNPPAFVLRTYGYHDDGSKSPKSVPATMSVHTPAFDPPPSSKPQTSEQFSIDSWEY